MNTKKPHIFQRIDYTFFRPSKAARAYKFAKVLLEKNVNTPKEAAYIEMGCKLLFKQGYFISLECGDENLRKLETPDFDKKLASEFAAYLVELHEKDIFHGDLNLGNILYHIDENGKYIFTLIDINRSSFKPLSKKDCFINMQRITHDHKLLEYIVREYAPLRGWDVESSVTEAIKYLNRFERNMNLKKRFKKKKTSSSY